MVIWQLVASYVAAHSVLVTVADRFTQVFLLEIDEATMLARLDARRDHHDWGRNGDTREYLRRKLLVLQDSLRASGAIPVDARQPLDQVVDAILARTAGQSIQ
jgi:thymidylate kinase